MARPSEPNARSAGGTPGTEARVGTLELNGARYRAFDMQHAFVGWTKSSTSRTPGFLGRYYNLPEGHPDMQSAGSGQHQGLVQTSLPLRLTTAGEREYNQFDWWDDRYFSVSRVDETLDWSSDFFPLDEGMSGDPYHFAVHWSATMVVSEDDLYTFATNSDDDSWVFIDDELVVDNGGLHARSRQRGSVDLLAGEHSVDIFFAERHRSGSNFTFDPDSRAVFYATGSPDETPGELAPLVERKRSLARAIDDAAQALEDSPRVNRTLDDLVARVDRGDLAEADVLEAVQRMLLGENVSQAAISAIGPAGDDGSYDPGSHDGRVQTPTDMARFDTAILAVDGFISTIVGILLSQKALDHLSDLMPGWLSGKLDWAVKKLDDMVHSVVKVVLGAFDDLITRVRGTSLGLADDLEEPLAEGGKSAAQKVGTKLFDRISQLDREFAGVLAGFFETATPNNFDDALDDLDAHLGGDGSIATTGDLSAATAEAQRGIDEIHDEVEGAKRAYEFLDLVTNIVDVLEVVGVALAASGILFAAGATVETAALIVSSLFNITKSLVGVGTVHAVADTHQETLRDVVSPTGGV